MAWYYDKQELNNTPSIRDGMTHKAERQYRKEGACLIIELCIRMDLGFRTMATGVVCFQRFYMVHSLCTFPHYLTACCALFLAGKIEETPKVGKQILKIAKLYVQPSEFTKFGEDPVKELLVLESIMLQSIKFDIMFDHPYEFLLEYGKLLKNGKHRRHRKIEDILSKAWTFVNDSFWCTTLCLQWEPEIVAIAMLYLAIKVNKYNIDHWVEEVNWWDKFVEGLTKDQIEDICHEVTDLSFLNSPQTNCDLELNNAEDQRSHNSNCSIQSIGNTRPLSKTQVIGDTFDNLPLLTQSPQPVSHSHSSVPHSTSTPYSPTPTEFSLSPSSLPPTPNFLTESLLPPPPLPPPLWPMSLESLSSPTLSPLSISPSYTPSSPSSVCTPCSSLLSSSIPSSVSPFPPRPNSNVNFGRYFCRRKFKDIPPPPPPPPPFMFLQLHRLPPIYRPPLLFNTLHNSMR